ncbi:unnamed protein product [Pleuronectes platessa]|uniref:Uncharacterized protein n=1 Tax=Pleuronectes platessa TaxID=8262 RepID=A0A9N7YLJ4_PLEPL|nr:unnamed protein product [Pleuronectes platessa]
MTCGVNSSPSSSALPRLGPRLPSDKSLVCDEYNGRNDFQKNLPLVPFRDVVGHVRVKDSRWSSRGFWTVCELTATGRVMSRRSSRLLSGGYYNSDEESDSSSVTNISYRENPVKVFKKKAGTRKASPRTSSRANSNASSPSLESTTTADQCDGPSPSPSSSQPPAVMKTETYVFPGSDPSSCPDPVILPESNPHMLPLRASREEPVRGTLQLHQARITPQAPPQGAGSERSGQLGLLVLRGYLQEAPRGPQQLR